MLHSAAIGAAGKNHPFGGGLAIVFPDFALPATWKPISRGQTQERKRVVLQLWATAAGSLKRL